MLSFFFFPLKIEKKILKISPYIFLIKFNLIFFFINNTKKNCF
jgi:hypothetical protein